MVLGDTEILASLKNAERELTGIRARRVDVVQEIDGWKGRNGSLRHLIANAEKESKMNRELYQKNYISLPRLLQIESQKTQAEITMGEKLAELARAMQKKAELDAVEFSAFGPIAVAQQRLMRVRILSPQEGITSDM
ncbi:MAG: aprE [Proteobacteria bacterium]|nr:aprE [Pseudomonadota bacterium]